MTVVHGQKKEAADSVLVLHPQLRWSTRAVVRGVVDVGVHVVPVQCLSDMAVGVHPRRDYHIVEEVRIDYHIMVVVVEVDILEGDPQIPTNEAVEDQAVRDMVCVEVPWHRWDTTAQHLVPVVVLVMGE